MLCAGKCLEVDLVKVHVVTERKQTIFPDNATCQATERKWESLAVLIAEQDGLHSPGRQVLPTSPQASLFKAP